MVAGWPTSPRNPARSTVGCLVTVQRRRTLTRTNPAVDRKTRAPAAYTASAQAEDLPWSPAAPPGAAAWRWPWPAVCSSTAPMRPRVLGDRRGGSVVEYLLL